jgi:hypothetical protein
VKVKIPITLRYQGKFYTYDDNVEPWIDEITGEIERSALDVARWMYNEGNYSCDCNKSLFLQRNCGVDFEHVPGATRFGCDEWDDIAAYDWEWELPCGNTIETISPRYSDDPILFLPKQETLQ